MLAVAGPGRGRLPARGPAAERVVRLARRPVLFALLRALAEAWPGEAGARAPDRARLRGPPDERLAPRPAAGRDGTAARRSCGRWRSVRATARRLRAGPAARSADGAAAGPAHREPGRARCWRCSPMARPGRRRRWRWRWASSQRTRAAGAGRRWTTAGQVRAARPRPRPALAGRPGRRIHDDLVTPGAARRSAKNGSMSKEPKRSGSGGSSGRTSPPRSSASTARSPGRPRPTA